MTKEKIVQSFASPKEAEAEAARRVATASRDAVRHANRTPSMDELWALLKAKNLVIQEDLP